MSPNKRDAFRGLYGKFKIERVDGLSEPGQKHDGCSYFVLDLTHDPHAIPAIRAYVESCEADFPNLAWALLGEITESEEPKDD